MMSRLFERLSAIPFPSAKGHLIVFLFFLSLAFGIRFYGFHTSVIDWDESTYLLAAKSMLQGKVLYQDIWDTKPPGIFWIVAAIQFLFTDAIFALRVIGTIVIALTAFLLFRIGNRLNNDSPQVGLFAGIFYILGISFHTFGFTLGRGLGLEVNTEVFFLFFTVLGAFLLFRYRENTIFLFLAGLSLGFGFIIKYFVLFDALALLSLLVLIHLSQKQFSLKLILRFLALGLGSILPFMLVWGYYYFQSGMFDLFHEVTFEVGSRYSEPFSMVKLLTFLGNFFYLEGVIAIAFIATVVLVIRKRVHGLNYPYAWMLIWLLWIMIGITLVGKFHLHYMHQLLPPFCLLAASIFSKDLVPFPASRRRLIHASAIILLVLIPTIAVIRFASFGQQPDYPREIAGYLKNKYPEGIPMVYVDYYKHILYYLINQEPPSQYYHPSLIFMDSHVRALGIDRKEELQKVLAQRPEYIIYEKHPSTKALNPTLEEQFVLEKTFEKDIFLLRRK